MQFPFSSADLMLWLGVTAILLLVTSEFVSPYYGQVDLFLEKRKLRLTALVLSVLFLLVTLIQIYEIFTY